MRCTWMLLLVLGCDHDRPAPTDQKPAEATTRKLAGVYPEQFKCDSIVTLDEIGGVLEGTAHPMETALSMPRGLPQPCNYAVTTRTQNEFWTFDLDCRDGYKQRADALFEQYRTGSKDLVDQYNALSDAGIKPTDAGIPIHAPEPAVEVAVGAKGLDHHGQGLVFVDDDAPCYVRVVGPDAARRLELAKLIAKHLTFANAPMTPRPMQ